MAAVAPIDSARISPAWPLVHYGGGSQGKVELPPGGFNINILGERPELWSVAGLRLGSW